MIKEIGKIIKVEMKEGKEVAYVECISRSACASCSSQNSCGVGAVAKTIPPKSMLFEVDYVKGMNVDHDVQLSLNQNDLVKSALLLYLTPLIFFITSAVIANYFGLPEYLIIFSAIIFGGVGLLFVAKITKNSAVKLKVLVQDIKAG
ncbi:MAG: SoxR reducing system RseC family protein [Psychromonas sp.]|nr:SoxR reducing system RseC family protein [Psychromonas sp.]